MSCLRSRRCSRFPARSRRAPQLADPGPIAIPAGLTTAQVAKEIKRALIGRGWTVTASARTIDSTLHLREHVARIKVDYDASQVRIAYVDSSNLDFRKACKRYIHATTWLDRLPVNDISTNLL